MKLLQSCITCCCLLLFSAAYTQPKSGWVTGPDGKLKYIYKPATAKPYTPQLNTGRPVKKEKETEDKNFFFSHKGEYQTDDGTYKGEYRSNSYIKQRHGYGKCTYRNDNVYEGNWLADKMHGQGTYTTASGKKYTGVWKAGKFVGMGTFNSDILGVKDGVTKSVDLSLPFSVTEYDTLIVSVDGAGKDYGYVDGKGLTRVAKIYQYASEFKGGYALVSMNDKYGTIDVFGKISVPIIYEKTGFRFYEGLLRMMLNGKWGFIDVKGTTLVPFIYEEATFFSEGLAFVKFDGKWGYVNKTGKVVIPFKYNDIYQGMFSDGLAMVKLGTKYGFINTKGVEVIPVIYDVAYSFQNGKVKLELNSVTTYFDKTGKKVSQ